MKMTELWRFIWFWGGFGTSPHLEKEMLGKRNFAVVYGQGGDQVDPGSRASVAQDLWHGFSNISSHMVTPTCQGLCCKFPACPRWE